MSHGGVISVLRKYLIGLGYRIHSSLTSQAEDFWEVRNCSITEVHLGDRGPGEFVRMGDWDHVLDSLNSMYTRERLENSTG